MSLSIKMDVVQLEIRSVNSFTSDIHARVDASWIRIIFIALKKGDLPADRIFQNAGIDVSKTKNKEFVSQSSVHILYTIIEEYGALNRLPIFVINVFQFHFLRYIGNTLLDVNSISDLLSKIVFVTSRISELIQADISTDAKYTKLSLSSAISSRQLHPITLATSICLIVEIVSRIFPNASEVIVNVIVSNDAPVSELEKYFKCPIIVSENGANAVVFERKLLNTVNIFPTHSINLSDAISNSTTKSDLSIYSEVERLILKNVSKPDFTISDVAESMNKTAKTLQRVLGRFDTSFSKIEQLNKKRLAIFHLKEGLLTIQQISFALGFVSPSSFSRAFKKWTGYSPSKFKDDE